MIWLVCSSGSKMLFHISKHVHLWLMHRRVTRSRPRVARTAAIAPHPCVPADVVANTDEGADAWTRP